MRIIFAKHNDSPKEYIFEVPENLQPEKGDVLYVRTVRGNTVAEATSNTIHLQDYEEVVEKFGAYLPLQKVRTYANREMIAYIESEFIERIRLDRFRGACMEYAGSEDVAF